MLAIEPQITITFDEWKSILSICNNLQGDDNWPWCTSRKWPWNGFLQWQYGYIFFLMFLGLNILFGFDWLLLMFLMEGRIYILDMYNPGIYPFVSCRFQTWILLISSSTRACIYTHTHVHFYFWLISSFHLF